MHEKLKGGCSGWSSLTLGPPPPGMPGGGCCLNLCQERVERVSFSNVNIQSQTRGGAPWEDRGCGERPRLLMGHPAPAFRWSVSEAVPWLHIKYVFFLLF